MEQFKYLENTSFGKPKTPSNWKGEPDYLPITRIRMSCGGGIGGASWYEYVHRVEEIPSNELVTFTRYNGKDITLNTSYIVSAEDFTLARAELDITEWNALSKCPNESSIETYYVLIDDNTKLVLK